MRVKHVSGRDSGAATPCLLQQQETLVSTGVTAALRGLKGVGKLV